MATFSVAPSDSHLVLLLPPSSWQSGSEIDGNATSQAVFTSQNGATLFYAFVGDATSVLGDTRPGTRATVSVDGQETQLDPDPNGQTVPDPYPLFSVQNLDPETKHNVAITFEANPNLYISAILFDGRPAEPDPGANPPSSPTVASVEPPTTPQTTPVISIEPTPVESGGIPFGATSASVSSAAPSETLSIEVGGPVPTELSGPRTSLSGALPSNSPSPLPGNGKLAGIVAGAVGGLFVSLILISIAVWSIRRKRKRRRVYQLATGIGVTTDVRVSQAGLVASGAEMAQTDDVPVGPVLTFAHYPVSSSQQTQHSAPKPSRLSRLWGLSRGKKHTSWAFLAPQPGLPFAGVPAHPDDNRT